MWIVRLALNRPYTFVVVSMLVLILSIVAILRTPTDIFPNINIPVVTISFQYAGMAPEDMERRIITILERTATTTVNDIEHMESNSYHNMGIIKIFFHPRVSIDGAVAECAAIGSASLRQMPPGTTPPFIITYNASTVPILQLGLSSDTLNEGQLNDLGVNFLRVQLATVEGAAIPYPFGGKNRQINVDLDPEALKAFGISGQEVVNAVNNQNLILPQGSIKIGQREYDVQMNSTPARVDEMNNMPVKVANGSMVYLKDLAHVHDGFAFQTNIVHMDGRRGSLVVIFKNGNASTLDIISDVYKALPRIASTLPPELKITPLADQSIFVRAAIEGVLKEAITAACLTAAMILLFLGSWRSTIIVAISIPLSILTSLLVMSALGNSINLMTLGGLALAVGILVDDATVEIENINRLIPDGMSLRQTILTGAQQIAAPAFVATLAICIVFVPIFFLTGISGYLFRPLAEAVVFAMLASYFLSRTLVPTMVLYLFRYEHRRFSGEPGAAEAEEVDDRHERPGFFYRIHLSFERGFGSLRNFYLGILSWCLRNRLVFGSVFLVGCAASMLLVPYLGQDLFPSVDSGQIRMHIRAPIGMRVEETAALCDRVEHTVREVIPATELSSILDNVGMPFSSIATSYSTSGSIGASDADVLISLKKEHRPSAEFAKNLRKRLPDEYPSTQFFFQPADIVSQILNFGLPSPIDVQLVGPNFEDNFKVASAMLQRIRQIPGAADVHIQQALDQPTLEIDVDRTKAQQLGFTEQDVANEALVGLTSSFQTAPNFWLSPQGVSYNVATQTTQYRMDSLEALAGLPVIASAAKRQAMEAGNPVRPENAAAAGGVPQPQLLSNLATFKRRSTLAVVSHRDVQRVVDIYLSPQGRDLGSVARDVDKILEEFRPKLPRGSYMETRGQVETMRTSFEGLAYGLFFSILLVYLLMVVNFQSWTDPFIIITALPGALAGIAWALFIWHTTLSVPSLMGAIMSVGVATSNSILMVTFANSELRDGKDSIHAALSAGFTRLRPVVMTALAMIIGMVPMALGLGEGGEQNAPLGRAVIGGLVVATIATLLFVPVVFSFVRRHGLPISAAEAETEE
jgi:multidrug efflux pump subunit AcrB